MSSRRGFTVSSFSMWVLLLFLAVAAAHLIWAMNDPRWQMKGLVPFLLLFVGFPLILAAVLGFTAWLLGRKSDLAGNFTFCTILLLMAGMRLALITGVMPKGFSFRGSLNSLRSAPPAPAPIDHSPAQSTPPRNTPAHLARPPAAPQQPTHANPTIAQALDKLSEEIAADVAAMWPDVQKAFSDWGRPPRHDMTALNERLSQAVTTKAAADKLGSRLRNLKDEAQRRLTAAGVNSAIASGEAGHYTVRFNSNWRATACDAVARACDRAKEEADFLRQNFAKWSLDAKGEIASSDMQVQGRARGMRSSLEFAIRDADRLKQRLDEGR